MRATLARHGHALAVAVALASLLAIVAAVRLGHGPATAAGHQAVALAVILCGVLAAAATGFSLIARVERAVARRRLATTSSAD